MKTEQFEMVAKTFQGLEDVLAQEITNLGAENIEIGKRMVSFTGDKEMLYKANLHCRTALRILKPIYKFVANNTDQVYEKIKQFEWENLLNTNSTFAIESVVFSEDFKHSKFVTYRAKDAIVDYFTEKYEKRPSVRLSNADIMLNLHISHNNCTLSLDSSGESLHKRGYRVKQTEAPLNEVLAAGMILKTGWTGESNFVDPMCGSGTLLIEAAMIATNTAPGIYRKDFAFEKWSDYDKDLFDELYNDDSQERPYEFRISGSDISPIAIAIAEENIKSAGFSQYISLQTKPLQQYQEMPQKGILVTNPPYGERINPQDLLGLYEMIGERLKHVFKGYDAWIISYREECFDKIGLKPSVKLPMMNGALDCEYRKYEIFDGKYKEFKQENKSLKKEGYDNRDSFEKREWKPFKKSDTNNERKPFNDDERRERKPFNRDERGERKPFNRDDRGERKPFNRDDRGERKPFNRDERGERKPFNRDERGERKPFNRDERGERKPFNRDDRGERKPFNRDDRGERRPFNRDDRGERKPFNRDDRGERKPFNRDDRGERKPFNRDDRGERKPFNSDRRERKPFNKEDKWDKKGENSQESYEFIHGEEAFNKFVNYRKPSISGDGHAPVLGMKMRERKGDNKKQKDEEQ